MKKITKVASAVLTAGILVSAYVPVFAANNAGVLAASGSAVPVNLSDNNFMKGGISFSTNKISELTEEQKAEMISKMKEKLAQQLAEGKITQAQYNEAIAAIADGKTNIFIDGERFGAERIAIAEITAQTKERLAAQLADGKITQAQYDQAIAEIAEGKLIMSFGRGELNIVKNELTEEQKAEMTAQMKERLAAQLADGKITQAQYDQAIAEIAEGKISIFIEKGLGNIDKPVITNSKKSEAITVGNSKQI